MNSGDWPSGLPRPGSTSVRRSVVERLRRLERYAAYEEQVLMLGEGDLFHCWIIRKDGSESPASVDRRLTQDEGEAEERGLLVTPEESKALRARRMGG